MQMKKTLLAALLVAAPFSTMAASTSNGNLDVYYVDSSLELDAGGTVDFDGDGFGVRGSGKIADNVFVFGEYQNVEYDPINGVELEFQQLRAGLGYLFSSSEQVDFYGKASFLNFQLESNVTDSADDNGWGVHGGLAFKPASGVTLFGELGYIDVGDLSGPEYNIGASFNFTEQFGVVANYRISDQETDDDTGVNIQDLQLGIRLNF